MANSFSDFLSEILCFIFVGGAHNDLLIDAIRKTSKGDGGKDIRRRKRRRKEKVETGPVEGGPVTVESNGIVPTVELGGGEASVAVMGPPLPPPPPPPIPAPSPSPSASSYLKTALWSRKQRISQQGANTSSSQETISNTPTKPHKKPGPLKKIVRKLF